jgi:hypothetical protein
MSYGRCNKKDRMMLLQKMKNDGGFTEPDEEVICGVDGTMGLEFTICGCTIVDSAGEEWKSVGEMFDGKIKDITCQICRDHIEFYKNLE